MQLTIYYDYTCEDSYQVYHWLEKAGPHRPDLHLTWATFLLREFTRSADTPSLFESGAPCDPALTALALSHAARQADFSRYHQLVFNALHGAGQPLTEESLFDWARQAGIDVDDFRANRARWIQEVAHDHEYGRKRWGVRSTPTLVVNARAVATLKLSGPPESDTRALEMLDRLALLLLDFPEVLALRRLG